MSIGVRGVDRHLTQELLQVTLVGRVLSSVTRQRRRRKNTLGRDSCMFHVTMRTLRNVGCRGCAVGEELFPSCEDGCAETGPWGRRACKRVNSAVNEGNGVSRNRCGSQDTESAPGREGPASDGGGCCCSERFMEKDGRCRGRVKASAGTSSAIRNTWICSNVSTRPRGSNSHDRDKSNTMLGQFRLLFLYPKDTM
jgi:hypothetical protein